MISIDITDFFRPLALSIDEIIDTIKAASVAYRHSFFIYLLVYVFGALYLDRSFFRIRPEMMVGEVETNTKTALLQQIDDLLKSYSSINWTARYGKNISYYAFALPHVFSPIIRFWRPFWRIVSQLHQESNI